jgi:hypothetical protein
MPNFLESKLKREAGKKGLKGNQADRYVYGAMNNMGAMKGSKVTEKGEEMQEKHLADKAKAARKGKLGKKLSKAEHMLGPGAVMASKGR